MAYPLDYKRECPTHGVMYEKTTQINELPEVGSVVIVERLKILNRVGENGEHSTYTPYDERSPYVNIWGEPIAFTVAGYSKGIDNPLDPSNRITLTYKNADGSTGISSIQAIHVATGSNRLRAVDKK